jgi:hypothetical protein
MNGDGWHCFFSASLSVIRHEGNTPKARSNSIKGGVELMVDIPNIADDDFYPLNEPIKLAAS